MRGYLKHLGASLALLLSVAVSSTAFAQGAIQQSGAVTPFHAPAWYQNGVQGDGGTPAAPMLNALGLFNGANCPFGVSSQTGPGVSTSPYSLFSICQSATATTLHFSGANGQATPNVFFQIGAVSYPFPGPGNGNVVGPAPSTIGHTACYATSFGTILADCAAVVFADVQPGSDMGAKINAAIALLPATGGEVDARGLLGAQTLSTAVAVPANVFLRFGCGTTIVYSTMITLSGAAAGVEGCPGGIGQGNNFGPTRFIQASGANLSGLFVVSGGQNTIRDLVIDGNKIQNSTLASLVNVTTGHFYLANLTLQNSTGSGYALTSAGTTNTACCGTVFNVVSIANSGDGLYCTGTADVIIEASSFENNAGAAGVELNNCPATRLVNYDIGGNVVGLWVHGAAYNPGVSLGSYGQIVGAGQFGGQSKQDILIDGSSGGSYNNLITGASLLGSQNRASNIYASVDLHDMAQGGNILSGLQINSLSSNTSTSAVYIHGAEGNDTIGPVRAAGTYGGVTFNVPATTSLLDACDTSAGSCQTNYGNYLNGIAVGDTTGYSWTAETSGANAGDSSALAVLNPSTAAYSTANIDGLVGASLRIGSIQFQRNSSGSGGTLFLKSATSGGLMTTALTIDQDQNTTLAGTLGVPQSTWANNQACTAGQVSVDASYIYVCTAANTVKRAALSTF